MICFVYARTARGIEIYFELNVVYVYVGLEFGHIFWKLCSCDGCGFGIGHAFGKLVCVHCCWAGDWIFALAIVVQCWDWTDDLTFIMDVVFVV